MCVNRIAAPEIPSWVGAGPRLVWALVTEGTPEVVLTPVPFYLPELSMPVEAASDSAEDWDLAVEICDCSWVIDVVVVGVGVVGVVLQCSTAGTGPLSGILGHRLEGGLV